jgi:6-phosphofructokinase
MSRRTGMSRSVLGRLKEGNEGVKRRIGILTGGGDVPPLNTVIAAAVAEADTLGVELIGFVRGWQGILNNDWVCLSSRMVPSRVGGTVLKSSRTNIGKTAMGPDCALQALSALGLSGLIVIGGEDTLSNTFLLGSFPQALISKTIDNDIGVAGAPDTDFEPEKILNYFTLGFPTAAEKIVSFVSLAEGLRTTAYSHERIVIVESMGMSAGWLALASGLGDPDLVIIPEFPVDIEAVVVRTLEIYARRKHAVIVVAEGAKWQDGAFFHAAEDENKDFGHPRFGGSSGALRDKLKERLSGRIDTRNINAVNPSYLYRSGAPNALDALWAEKLGKRAVRLLADGVIGPNLLSIQKSEEGFCSAEKPLSEFASIEELHRKVDRRFYDPHEFAMSEVGRRYMKEIVREMPDDPDYGLGIRGGNGIH